MEVTIRDVSELPARTQICLRYGEMRKLAPFRAGEKISFPTDMPADQLPKYYTVDVLRKVGTAKVSIAGIEALGGSVRQEKLEIPSLDMGSPPITVSFDATLGKAPEMKAVDESKKQQVAIRAKQYLEKHGVQTVLHEMFTQLLERLPADPLAYMADYLDKQRDALDEGAEPRDYSLEPGLGDRPLPGFADGKSPEDLPSLDQHHSLIADVLRQDASAYESLRHSTTGLGVTLAQCIKPGVDCPGHEMVKVAGLYAGDADCYQKYEAVFGPVVRKLHGAAANGLHPSDFDPDKLTNARIDPTGKYAKFASVETRRNIQNIRMPSSCSREERREVERIAANALLRMDGDHKGFYLPLRSSASHPGKAGGMAAHEEEHLRKAGLLFAEPDSRMRLSAGLGRQWPDARGVYTSEMQSFYAWINEEDHLRFFARHGRGQHSDVDKAVDIKALWQRVCGAMKAVKKAAEENGYGYSQDKRLGFLTSCPSRLGTALRVSVYLNIPYLATSVDLPSLCRSLMLQCGQEVGSERGSFWTVTNQDTLGIAEVDIVNSVIMGCSTLVAMEQRLEKGEPVYNSMPGLGADAFPGFPSSRCPARLPDLSCHHNLMATVLKEDSSIYPELRRLKTGRGASLAECIKPGIDDVGHSSAALVPGIVAVDEECYDVFSKLFDPVISRLHGVDSPPRASTSSVALSTKQVKAASVRVELRRNFSGLKLLPSASQDDRREVERLLVKGMLNINEFAGDYLPLAWSDSYMPKPGGMTQSEQEKLESESLLFKEPTTVSKLAAGFGRGWPDARGAYVTDQHDLCIWCNEEDHLRFIAAQQGGDLQAAFNRASACAKRLEEEVGSFATNPRLGVLTASPEHLGVGLCVTVSVALKHLSTHADFKTLCEALGLSAHWRGGIWDISAAVSGLKLSEAALVNCVVEGCAHLMHLDENHGKGTPIEDDIRQTLFLCKCNHDPVGTA